eukprot:TRINITY_DN17455_c0_g1_i1.p1 TRINITY_DN17455_c0_g1~~TRINITY_DN17455_c0_g1_i1.p1  ORF type:complete len:270 (+),score=62.16 TRINITY_DN17455_c0_g1_i1:101-910(+)
MLRSLVGSEMCIRDRVSTQSTGKANVRMEQERPTTYHYDKVRASFDAVPAQRVMPSSSMVPAAVLSELSSRSVALDAGERASRMLKDLEHDHGASVHETLYLADHLRQMEGKLGQTKQEMEANQAAMQREREAILSEWKSDHQRLKHMGQETARRAQQAEAAAADLASRQASMAERERGYQAEMRDMADRLRRAPPPMLLHHGYSPLPSLPRHAGPDIAGFERELAALKSQSAHLQERAQAFDARSPTHMYHRYPGPHYPAHLPHVHLD